MLQDKLEQYIAKTYDVERERLWVKYPNYAVFRHKNNKKWFAIIMDIPYRKLGIDKDGLVFVANFKCEPALIELLLSEKGIFSAYHMNKNNWIT